MATETLGRLKELLPAIRARREEIEKARRMPRDLIDELSRLRIFSLGVPQDMGGQQAHPAEILRVIETLSSADGSTGWCAAVGIANNLTAGYLNDRGAREVYAKPDVPSAGLARRPALPSEATRSARHGPVAVRERYHPRDWVWAGCMVMEDGKPRMTTHGPEIVHVCMPVREVQIHDTWHVSGLAGTGSHDFSVTDILVPGQRVFLLLDSSQHRPEPLYQLPPLGWFVSQVAAVSLGIARGALDELVELAQSKVPTFSMAVLADRPVAQIELARAEAALGSARAFLYESVQDLWDTLSAGRPITPRQIAVNRIATSNAAEVGAAVTRTANVLAGGSAIYNASSMQRHMRDAEALTHHFTVAPHVWEDAGRVFLGRQPTAPVF